MLLLKSSSALQSLVQGTLFRYETVNKLTTSVDRHNAALYQYPTYLPFEILSKIFINCIHSDRCQQPQPNVNVAPLLLCRVCRHWRDVAMAVPKLWVDLNYRLPATSQSLQLCNNLIPPEELEFIDSWVTNARPYPPSLRIIKYRIWPKREILDQSVSFEDFCASRSVRSSRSLELELSKNDFRAICASKIPFQNLEYLMMVGTLKDDGLSSSMSLKFPPSPLLRQLHLDCGFSKSIERIIRALPFVQLTRLCIEWDINDAEWLELLERSPNLQYGLFKLRGRSHLLSTKTTKLLLHSHMRQMILSCTNFDALSATFEGLLFPVMQSLRLATPYECQTSSNITTEEFQVILRSTPGLTELHIQSCLKISDSAADSSNRIQYGLSTCVPNLKVFLIDKVNNIVSSRHLIPFLRSNWLNGGWSSGSRIRVEIVLINHRHFLSSGTAIKAVISYIDSLCDDDLLEVVLRQENEAHWEWAYPPSRDVNMKFYHVDHV